MAGCLIRHHPHIVNMIMTKESMQYYIFIHLSVHLLRCFWRPSLKNTSPIHFYWATRLHSLTHSLIYILIHSLTRSLTHSLTHSLTQSFIHSFSHLYTHSLTHSLNHSFIYLLTPSLTHSLTPSFIHSFIYILTHSLIYLIFFSLPQSLIINLAQCFRNPHRLTLFW